MKTREEIEKTLEVKLIDALGWIQIDKTFSSRVVATKLLKSAVMEAIRDTLALEKKDG